MHRLCLNTVTLALIGTKVKATESDPYIGELGSQVIM